MSKQISFFQRKTHRLFSFLTISMLPFSIFAQSANIEAKNTFEHTCFDIQHYDLSVKIDLEKRTISGVNKISFDVLKNTSRIQLELQQVMTLDSILLKGKKLDFSSENTSFFVYFPNELTTDSKETIAVYYHGTPIVAKNAPWDGGFVFSKDAAGNPFIGVACQGLGASSWWPTKEFLSDRATADLHFEVPSELQAISNGQFLGKTEKGKTAVWNWKVTYPISNYDVSVTIGKFAHFSDTFKSKLGSYPIDYYVLTENLEKAKKQFQQVKPMLKAYEYYFGQYPFARDGFKLVEAPYLGMEHQSAVAYGNHYLQGYAGRFFAPISEKFDFIIIHESGHEYWGNSVAMSDLSDMWINEGFCTYSELLYVEKVFGKKYTEDYANYWTTVISNKEPIVNERYSNREPSGDIYYKGALLLKTLRSSIHNDRVFFACLKAIQQHFAHQTVSTEEMVDFMCQQLQAHSSVDLRKIFDQFLHRANPPMLNYRLVPSGKKNEYVFKYKWDMVVDGFSMPFSVKIGKKRYEFKATTEWQSITLKSKKSPELDFLKDFYFLLVLE